MGNIGQSKLYYMLLALLLFALTGCSGGGGGGSAESGKGSITAKVTYGDSAKALAKTVALVPTGVTKLRMRVSGAGIPVVTNEITVAAGDDVQAQVNGIYPGTVSLVVEAMNASGVVLYEGFALRVVVTEGNQTDVGTIRMTPPTVKAADTQCKSCHETTIDVNGQNLVADFKQSGHYTNLSFKDGGGIGAGCFGCHGAHAVADPSAGGTTSRCFECHNANPTVTTNHDEYLKNSTPCSACHEVHNTKLAQSERKTWAQSGHAVVGGPFAGHNTGGCSRCHNPIGLIAILANPAGTSQPTAADPQNISCSACHTNAVTGDLRTLAGTTFTNYTGSTGWTPSASVNYALNYGKKGYPDVKESNMCIQCHDSRQNDPGAITSATTAYTRTHYLQAATLMYVKMGFINFSTGTTYLNSLKSSADGGTITSYHRRLGTPAIIGFDGVTANDTAYTTKGPCVACHLTGSHTLKMDQAAISSFCNKCHSSELGWDITNIAAFEQHFLEPQSEVYQNALNLAIATFNSKQTIVTITPEDQDPTVEFVRPYLTSDLTKEATATNLTGIGSSWTAIATAGGWDRTKLLGAIGNIILFKNEPGGYAHARTYSRRLIYDTIDYLDDASMNNSVEATAIAWDSTIYTKGAKAFNTTNNEPTSLATGTSESMTFLLGYTRSSGAWTTPARP